MARLALFRKSSGVGVGQQLVKLERKSDGLTSVPFETRSYGRRTALSARGASPARAYASRWEPLLEERCEHVGQIRMSDLTHLVGGVSRRMSEVDEPSEIDGRSDHDHIAFDGSDRARELVELLG